MKHIIIVLHTLAVGGAERHLTTVANYFAANGVKTTMLLIDNPVVKYDIHPDVEVICVNQSADVSDYEKEKCKLFVVSPNNRYVVFEKIKMRVRQLLKKTSRLKETESYLKFRYAIPLRVFIKQYPEAIVASFMTLPNISTMMAVWKLPNRALFCDFNDMSTEYPTGSPFNMLREKYYGRAQAAIFQTPTQSAFYSFLPELIKYVIPNPLFGDVLPLRFEGRRQKEIVNFCRLSVAKNLPLLIDAFALLHRDFPEYTLAIYGEGDLKQSLLEKIDALDLSSCAAIHDFDLNVHEKIKDAAMFVSSSDREGISNSMLEAMAIGLPCVCTDCAGGGARMMIEDHVNGLLVPMKDVNALYLAMKEVVENPELADAMSRNAVKIKDRLRPEKICRQMLDAILGVK